MNAFDRYAPYIQEYIYRKGWTDLREVQVEACAAILDTDDHVIVSSGTASGKTEAAFFPILTSLYETPSSSISVIYIGPLKALINDQFNRLEGILNDRGIPVWPWHGDVSQAVKARAIKNAEGILQITPESLEALLMRQPGQAAKMFADLRFIVIDEIHAFIGTDRGLQLLCLMQPLEAIAGCSPQRIGLSATLNDYSAVENYLSSGTDRKTLTVGIVSHKKKISIGVETFIDSSEQKTDIEINKSGEVSKNVLEQYNEYIYAHCHDKKAIIFTSGRGTSEKVTAAMKRIAKEREEKDVFLVHHGSVSASLREETEMKLRESTGPIVAAATLTLELGIDIGDLDLTIQLGPPLSSASFVQRLGRSGRRTGISKMLFLLYMNSQRNGSAGWLPLDLLKTIAVLQLYIRDRWVEPSGRKPKPFSLLAQQTLCALMTFGELSPSALAKKVLVLTPFTGTVSLDEYRFILRFMVNEDYIHQLENGNLIVGMKGEKITNYYSFYAVFQDNTEFHVIAAEGEIGTIGACPKIGEVFSLAGRNWVTTSVDNETNKVFVKKSGVSKIPAWSSEIKPIIDDRVMLEMRNILFSNDNYNYLSSQSKKLLEEARAFAKNDCLLSEPMFYTDSNEIVLMPWVGTKKLKTIEKLLDVGLKERLRIQHVKEMDYYLVIRSELLLEEFKSAILEIEIPFDAPDYVVDDHTYLWIDKYNYMIPEKMLKTAYLYNEMDVPGAMAVLKAAALGKFITD